MKKYIIALLGLLVLSSSLVFAESESPSTVQPHLFDDLNHNYTSDLAEETGSTDNVVDEIVDIELPPTPE